MANGFNFNGKHYTNQSGLTETDVSDMLVIHDYTKGILAELSEKVATAMEMIGLLAERYAKENIRRNGSIRTGRLRNSITHTTDGKDVYIGTNVEYGRFVELGTSKQGAKPYLRPAAEEHQDAYLKIMKQALGE